MKDMGIVHGSKEAAQPLIVSKDTVYVHTNIHEITIKDEIHGDYTIWEYNEIQYEKDEYIQLMAENEIKLKSNQDYLAIMAGVDLDE